ncbi:heavy-metal-associated domain-containing protein [Demequina oxidasica]|uniref:heavy-metal-associated domain-containing protein n=1 Tax=Demequina oxidasica TaxID=676199 RepID=UPI0007863533|nr:heavy metal-associated domain-containing protein [Demequina oxidasica]
MTTSTNIIELSVKGMTCEGCATTVREALVATDGISAADIDVATGKVTVHSDGTVPVDDLEFSIDEAVTQAGYTVGV